MLDGIKLLRKKLPYLLPSSTVLMFHHVTDEPTVKRSILMGTDRFRTFISTFDQYTDIRSCVHDYQKRKLAITFDDALSDIYTIAYPFLEKKGIPFTVFVAPGLLDQDGYITKNQLIELSRCPLVTVGSHSLSHVPLRGKPAEYQKKELLASKLFLENTIGKEVDMIAYPYGQYDSNTVKAVKSASLYDFGFLAAGGPINSLRIKRNLALPRLRVDDKTLSDVERLLSFVYK